MSNYRTLLVLMLGALVFGFAALFVELVYGHDILVNGDPTQQISITLKESGDVWLTTCPDGVRSLPDTRLNGGNQNATLTDHAIYSSKLVDVVGGITVISGGPKWVWVSHCPGGLPISVICVNRGGDGRMINLGALFTQCTVPAGTYLNIQLPTMVRGTVQWRMTP